MGGAGPLGKGSSGRDLYGIVPISLFQNEVGGGSSGASLPSEQPHPRNSRWESLGSDTPHTCLVASGAWHTSHMYTAKDSQAPTSTQH